jgi:inorganic pyrophosphatase
LRISVVVLGRPFAHLVAFGLGRLFWRGFAPGVMTLARLASLFAPGVGIRSGVISHGFFVSIRREPQSCLQPPARRRGSTCYERIMDIEVVIEIPKGTRNKYEADENGVLWLDRRLFTATAYPEDYGYVPQTLAADGDPLDAMVVLSEPTFPGCHIRARPLGMFLMRDEEGVDAKVLCAPATDPRSADVTELEHVPDYELNEIAHFFAIYKTLEPGKFTEITGWRDRAEAEAAIEECRERFRVRRVVDT